MVLKEKCQSGWICSLASFLSFFLSFYFCFNAQLVFDKEEFRGGPCGVDLEVLHDLDAPKNGPTFRNVDGMTPIRDCEAPKRKTIRKQQQNEKETINNSSNFFFFKVHFKLYS